METSEEDYVPSPQLYDTLSFFKEVFSESEFEKLNSVARIYSKKSYYSGYIYTKGLLHKDKWSKFWAELQGQTLRFWEFKNAKEDPKSGEYESLFPGEYSIHASKEAADKELRISLDSAICGICDILQGDLSESGFEFGFGLKIRNSPLIRVACPTSLTLKLWIGAIVISRYELSRILHGLTSLILSKPLPKALDSISRSGNYKRNSGYLVLRSLSEEPEECKKIIVYNEEPRKKWYSLRKKTESDSLVFQAPNCPSNLNLIGQKILFVSLVVSNRVLPLKVLHSPNCHAITEGKALAISVTTWEKEDPIDFSKPIVESFTRVQNFLITSANVPQIMNHLKSLSLASFTNYDIIQDIDYGNLNTSEYPDIWGQLYLSLEDLTNVKLEDLFKGDCLKALEEILRGKKEAASLNMLTMRSRMLKHLYDMYKLRDVDEYEERLSFSHKRPIKLASLFARDSLILSKDSIANDWSEIVHMNVLPSQYSVSQSLYSAPVSLSKGQPDSLNSRSPVPSRTSTYFTPTSNSGGYAPELKNSTVSCKNDLFQHQIDKRNTCQAHKTDCAAPSYKSHLVPGSRKTFCADAKTGRKVEMSCPQFEKGMAPIADKAAQEETQELPPSPPEDNPNSYVFPKEKTSPLNETLREQYPLSPPKDLTIQKEDVQEEHEHKEDLNEESSRDSSTENELNSEELSSENELNSEELSSENELNSEELSSEDESLNDEEVGQKDGDFSLQEQDNGYLYSRGTRMRYKTRFFSAQPAGEASVAKLANQRAQYSLMIPTRQPSYIDNDDVSNYTPSGRQYSSHTECSSDAYDNSRRTWRSSSMSTAREPKEVNLTEAPDWNPFFNPGSLIYESWKNDKVLSQQPKPSNGPFVQINPLTDHKNAYYVNKKIKDLKRDTRPIYAASQRFSDYKGPRYA